MQKGPALAMLVSGLMVAGLGQWRGHQGKVE
jgi:hypothetical protein